MGWRLGLCSWGVALVLLGFATAAGAEIYKWTDSSGRTRYAQDLSEVPRAHRAKALADYRSRADIQTYSTSGDSDVPASYSHFRSLTTTQTGSMRIPFEKQGTLMRVNVRLNDSVTAPFLVDTGASHISVPYWVIERLGVAITDSTPRRTAMTANGLVSEPIVNLSAVQLGPARVNNLDASVSGSMQIGLLGGSFFNNFIYQVDAAASVIILSPNDRVVSGLTEEQWRERFNGIREPLARLEAVLERGGFVDKQRVRQLEARRADLRAKLADLDALATRSEVPQRWRH